MLMRSELGAPVLNDDTIILQVPAVIRLLSCALEPLRPSRLGAAPLRREAARQQCPVSGSAVTFGTCWARFGRRYVCGSAPASWVKPTNE